MPDRDSDYWGERADRYDADTAWVVGSDVIDLVSEAIRSRSPLGDVIELGCGPGVFTERYAEWATRVVATDLSARMVGLASDRLAAVPNVDVRLADATATGLPGASADTVIALNLIHVVPDPAAVLTEVSRLLRADGSLLVGSVTVEGLPLARKASMGLRALVRFGPGLFRVRRDMDLGTLRSTVAASDLEVTRAELLRGEHSNVTWVEARRAG